MQSTVTSTRLVNALFFILPFFLFISVVSNAIGFYGLLFGSILFVIIKYKIKIPKYFLTFAYVLFAMYICFSISNILNLYFHNSTMPASFYNQKIQYLKLIKSRLPTQYLTVSLVFIVFYWIGQKLKHSAEQSLDELKKITPLECFLKGLFYASILFFIVFLVEAFFKLDYRYVIKTHAFISNPKYDPFDYLRPTGLLANPLTLASMSLACFAFLYTYFCRLFFVKTVADSALPFFNSRKKLFIYTLIPSLFFLGILLLTLSRTSVAISFLILILIPVLVSNNMNRFKAILFGFCIALLSYIVCYFLGYTERIVEAVQRLSSNGHMDNRGIFREIYTQMIFDHPWFGNGSYWISQGLRDHYFVELGYANLNERNFAAHNIYLELLASGGVICMAVVLYGIWKIQNILKRFVMTVHNQNRALWVAFVVAFLANAGHGLTQNNFLESSTTYTFFYLLIVIIWQTILNSQRTH